ncbi:heme peroxidase family protein [Methyloligella sp. 2.7D]|uniref:peroxidase family protein n=1 Tax=unclassified Methyloligella TaxID=2625955 RepID=UPI00157D02DD|nr:heme peroxidase family protein [Methyloligella sp. GL2]QKP76796.1 hypothetical protein HT051_04635 [Methyloligella sp. GL2]
MLKKISHAGGVTDTDEVLFATAFGYLFPELARSPRALLQEGQDTVRELLELGEAMAVDTGKPPKDSEIPSVFTYLGQFIDHDLTARTDRETTASEVFAPDGGSLPIKPRSPEEIVTTLKNGRRPQLDLDSAYGDGPSFLYQNGEPAPGSSTVAQDLYDSDLKFRLQSYKTKSIIDLHRPRSNQDHPRPNDRMALISDMRNDENVNVSQLHAAFLAFHNAIMDGLEMENKSRRSKKFSLTQRFAQARQYVRWTYQYIVVEQYLRTVCIPEVVIDVKRNGPAFYGPVSGGLPLFMPLEFSVAGFRFGHSMIRPSYKLRGAERRVETLLDVSSSEKEEKDRLLRFNRSGPDAWRLEEKFTVNWKDFVGANPANKARPIDSLLAAGLGQLPGMGGLTVMAHLAKRNLIRGFSLNIPTGQAVAAAFGVVPLTPKEIRDAESDGIGNVLDKTSFMERTPLWYYILRESAVQCGGNSLGVIGSHIVAETIIGLLKKDPNSYLNQYGVARNISKDGIEVPTKDGRVCVGSIEGLLHVAGVFPEGRTAVKQVKPRRRLGS